jgi:importin-5
VQHLQPHPASAPDIASTCTQECLDRLALSLGGNTLMPLVTRVLPGHMAAADWKQRHAALICLAQIAEGCVKAMLGHLDGLVGMCMQVRRLAAD